MKAVVVEIQNHTAAVLSEEGCIVKVKNQNYQIGQEVTISMKKQFISKKLLAFGSAAACFAFLIGGGTYAYYTPYSYVSLDVNPSIEYSINVFDKVLSASGVNDDGTAIVDEINLDNLENKSIEDAITLTVDQITEEGYLDSGEGGIVITTSSDNEDAADELAQDLEETATETVEENAVEAVVTTEAVGAERVAKARELGVTPGKLNLVEKLMESSADSESIDMNEWLHKSVKEIMKQTKLNKEQNKALEQNANEAVEAEETQSEEMITDTTSVETEETPATDSTDSSIPDAKAKKAENSKSSSNSKKADVPSNAASSQTEETDDSTSDSGSKKVKDSAATLSDTSATSSTDSNGNGNAKAAAVQSANAGTGNSAAASDNGNGNSDKKGNN